MSDVDVVIIGAGAAGLAAARDLDAAGLMAEVLEARDRIGGRIHSQHRGLVPVELGAEFVHELTGDMRAIVGAAGAPLVEVAERHWYLRDGRPDRSGAGGDELGEVMGRLPKSGPDRTFRQFLDDHFGGDDRRRLRETATLYVEGFHAADAQRISAIGLARTEQASAVGGGAEYRVLDGLGALAERLAAGLSPRSRVRLNHVAAEVVWRPGFAEVRVRSPGGTDLGVWRAKRVVVTVPLGVLQAGALRFTPDLPDKSAAAGALAMGQVVKVLLLFDDPLWESVRLSDGGGAANLSQLSFLHVPGAAMPVWWTWSPVRSPLLTGWVGGPAAEELLRAGERAVIEAALSSAAGMFGLPRTDLERRLVSAHFHDWQADPFARGAYSYVPVGGLEAQAELAGPVADTLYFAGEATHVGGEHATVHGAVATGRRAAAEILQSRGPMP